MNFNIVYARELDMYVKRKNALLIDIRSERLFNECHWEAAVSMPFETTDSYEKLLDKRKPLIFYCEHGGSSMKLARYLGKKGYDTATVIGGYEAMKNFMEKCFKK